MIIFKNNFSNYAFFNQTSEFYATEQDPELLSLNGTERIALCLQDCLYSKYALYL